MITQLLEPKTQEISEKSLLDNIAGGIDDRLVISEQPFMEWLDEYYYINALKFSLQGREPLKQIYLDTSPHMVMMKSAQCGISEYTVAYSCYFPTQFKENVFYAMPAKDQIKDFVQGRVDPRIDDSVRLQEIIKKTDNTGLKQVGLNFIYFRGSQNRRQIKSIDAGCLICDEYDEMIQNHIPIMEKRLGDSKYKIKKMVSVPTYFEYGIHQEFLDSDQHEYFLTCKCGKKFIPDWSKNIKPKPTRDKTVKAPDKVELVCANCGATIDRNRKGEWIAKNPGAAKRGYHISKLIFASVDLKELWVDFQQTRNLQDFYNSILGVPYAPEGGKLDNLILNACRETIEPEKDKDGNEKKITNCSMGVDVGDMLHVRISQRKDKKKIALYIGMVKEFEELDKLMKKYDVKCCIIDALPETRKAKEFANRFAGRVYLSYYLLADLNKTFEFKRSDRPMKVNINRNRAMDETGNRFIERETVLPMNANTIPGYYDQLKAPQKVKMTNKDGNEIYRFVEGNKADHFFHAEVYDDIAAWGQKRPDVIFV